MKSFFLRITLQIFAATLLLTSANSASGEAPPSEEPKIIPLTRPEMKSALEALKFRKPRLPLPPPGQDGAERSTVNNGRMRALYLPDEWSSFGSRDRSRNRSGGERTSGDASDTVDGTFKVWLFWIASRANNCHYCMGHQELKLRRAGMQDDEIAALDGDWSGFPADRRAAMEFTRKLTNFPHEIGDADVDALRAYYSDEQILEIVRTVAGYNSTNRWTDSLGIPQDQRFGDEAATIDTPTSAQFASAVSKVAPVGLPPRPALESREEVEAIWEKCRARKPRLPIADDAAVAKALPNESSSPTPNWVRALAAAGGRYVSSYRAVATTGRIDPKLKAKIAWCAARENRAWYSAHCAKRRLNDLGFDDAAVFAIDSSSEDLPAGEREALAFARKLTSTPHRVADADIARLREHYADPQVAEIVYVVCQANMFDRFTETVGLPLDQ